MCLGALLGALIAAPAWGHPMPADTRGKELYFAKRCGNSPTRAVLACVHRAAIHWGQDYRQMKAIAWRESNYRPEVCNSQGSGACGLFQFMPGTWASTPYGGYSVFSAKYASLATAWAWSRGWQSHWATY